jgi:hypothetical protein
VLRRFFFPAWRLESGPVLAPSDPLRLLSFEVPAGRLSARLESLALPVERWSSAMSGAALVICLALLLQIARRRETSLKPSR